MHSQDLNVNSPYCLPYISNFSLELNSQHFPGPVGLFQHFPDLENATVKFQDFSGFPGPVQTLWNAYSTEMKELIFEKDVSKCFTWASLHWVQFKVAWIKCQPNNSCQRHTFTCKSQSYANFHIQIIIL